MTTIVLSTVTKADDFLLSDLKGNGQGSLVQIIPSESWVYQSNCEIKVYGFDLTSRDKMTIRSVSVECPGHQILEKAVRFKKREGSLYYLDEDGFISTNPDGSYSSNGDFHFSFRRPSTVRVVETHIRDCEPYQVSKDYSINNYTEYNINKETQDIYNLNRYMTYEIMVSRVFEASGCNGVNGITYERHTFSHNFQGQIHTF